MGFKNVILVPVILGIGIAVLYNLVPETQIDVEETGYFGAGKPHLDNPQIKPFRVNVSDTVIEDLKNRLKNARIGHQFLEDSNDFYYGFNSKQLVNLRDYWLNKYDWKKYEGIINSFPQFITEIEGIKVHFIHAKPATGYKTTKPLLVVHGWPGNIFEFYKFIPILTDPRKFGIDSDFAFEVIAPSIPGYGWSEQPKKTGFSQLAAARVFRKLMLRLKFDNWYLQGGDWGSIIVSLMTRVWPDNINGIHLNMMPAMPGDSVLGTLLDVFGTFVPSFFSSKSVRENHNLFSKFGSMVVESGYLHIQATKPDTVGTALNDSPLGLAAYITEKFSTWTNLGYRALPDGGLNKKFTNDELLTIVMIYWVNGNIVSSQRFYRECFLDQRIRQLGRKYVAVPTGHASGLNEVFDRTPIEISRHFFNVTHYTEIDMGHFAAFEQPKLLAKSVFEFVQDL